MLISKFSGLLAERQLQNQHPRTHFTNAYWDVRTMYESAKFATTVREMNRYDMKILGVSETHQIGMAKL